MDFLSLSTALLSYQNILSEEEQWTFLRRQEVLLSPKEKLSRVVANYPVLKVGKHFLTYTDICTSFS